MTPLPRRFQRKRVKGWRKPANAVNVARPSRWGNPYKVGDVVQGFADDPFACTEITTPTQAAVIYGRYLRNCLAPDYPGLSSVRYALAHELRGRDLMCFCSPCQFCHADVLLVFANAPAGAEPAT